MTISLSFSSSINSQSPISDASTSHALSAVFIDTEVETALNNLATKLNQIITALESAGVIRQ